MARHPMGDWSPRAMDQTSACLPTTQHALPNAAVVVVVVLVAFDQPGYTLLFSSFFLFSSLLIRFFFLQHEVVPRWSSRFSTAGPLENGKQSARCNLRAMQREYEAMVRGKGTPRAAMSKRLGRFRRCIMHTR